MPLDYSEAFPHNKYTHAEITAPHLVCVFFLREMIAWMKPILFYDKVSYSHKQNEGPPPTLDVNAELTVGFVHDAWQARGESAEVLESEGNHVGLHWTPGASFLRFYTRRSFEAQINKCIRVFFLVGTPPPSGSTLEWISQSRFAKLWSVKKTAPLYPFWYLSYQNLGSSQVQLN